MIKQREALKLALEVLEEINKLSIGENAICLPAEIDTAMDAIREALAEPEQEPVAWLSEGGDVSRSKRYMDEMGFICEPLYTAPPARKPLTNEQISVIVQSMSAYTWDVYMLARRIEKAHGIGEA